MIRFPCDTIMSGPFRDEESLGCGSVAYETVRRAMMVLPERGLIKTAHGRGHSWLCRPGNLVSLPPRHPTNTLAPDWLPIGRSSRRALVLVHNARGYAPAGTHQDAMVFCPRSYGFAALAA